MAADTDTITKKLQILVDNYITNRASYIAKSSDYSETEVRTDFIDKIFHILNWDMYNESGRQLSSQEVRRERGPTCGEPDYTFRLPKSSGAATPVFFVEAKSPKEKLDQAKYVFQARSYAFSSAQSNLVLAVLTNFEEFRLYRVDHEPRLDENSEVGLLMKFKYDELIQNIDKLLLFEKSKVEAGSLNILGRRGVAVKDRPPVEASFLARLKEFRSNIAGAIYKANKKISFDQINSTTETIINRLVFIRFAEDRNIMPPEDLRLVVNQWKNKKTRQPLLTALNNYFEELDRRFNGRLFAPDDAILNCIIDDNVIIDVIENLYAPNCPYRFNQIRVELLGEIYEKHLGQVISLSKGKVVIDDKPEVRHAKGVYYTPAYIVDGVLSKTLQKNLDSCKTIDEIFSLRGIDPACGSGSFLLGCYRSLHDEILTRSIADKSLTNTYLEKNDDSQYRLKFKFKRKILENCLFGIDLDRRAVKVAELSMYLKLLEDEPDVSAHPIPYLPKLEMNLQCGNSLIDVSMVDRAETADDIQIMNRVKPLTWEGRHSFKNIMDKGGFDFIVTNPPYIRIQELRQFSDTETNVVMEHYETMKNGNPDIYIAFFSRCLEKAKKGGQVGFIVSSKFAVTNYGERIRKELATAHNVSDIIDFGDQQVFDGASTYTMVIAIQKGMTPDVTNVRLATVAPSAEAFKATPQSGYQDFKIKLSEYGNDIWEWRKVSVGENTGGMVMLGAICEIFQGLRTSDNQVFELVKAKKSGKTVTGYSKALKKIVKVEADICLDFLKGREIGRNSHLPVNSYLIFPYQENSPYELIPWSELKQKFPLAADYLSACKKRLCAREEGKVDNKKWYGYIYLKNHDLISQPKVMIQEMADRAHLCFDQSGSLAFVTGYGLHVKDDAARNVQHYRFLQAVIQSKRIDSKIVSSASKLRGGYFQYRKQYLTDIPVPVFDISNEMHQLICEAQKKIEEASQRASAFPSGDLKSELLHQVETLETEIEELLAAIYEQVDVVAA